LPFPVLIDASGTTIKNFGIFCWPTLIIIDPQGKIVRGMDLDELSQRLSQSSTARA
jgi:hypothetical protein